MPTQVGLYRLEKSHPTWLAGLTLNSQVYPFVGPLCQLALLSHFLVLDSPVPLDCFTLLLSSETSLCCILSCFQFHWEPEAIRIFMLCHGHLPQFTYTYLLSLRADFRAQVQLDTLHRILNLLKYSRTSSIILPFCGIRFFLHLTPLLLHFPPHYSKPPWHSFLLADATPCSSFLPWYYSNQAFSNTIPTKSQSILVIARRRKQNKSASGRLGFSFLPLPISNLSANLVGSVR